MGYVGTMPRPTRLVLETALYSALLLAFPLHGTVNAQTPDTLPPDPAPDAYLDETARRLMQGVRAARDTARLAVDSYTALTRERIRTDLPTLRRDRLWMHGERVARVRWSREEPNVVHLLASRLRYPGPGQDDVPDFFPGLETEFFAADPLWDPFGNPSFDRGLTAVAVAVHSPLETGSERYYQFRSGDTVTVRLEGGRTVEAVAVTVIPRYRSIRLVAAKLWIDRESLGLVRIASRPAKRVDREVSGRLRQGGEWRPRVRIEAGESASAADSSDNSPGLFDRLVNLGVDRMVKRVETDVSALIVDYGLSEALQWLPRRIRVAGYAAWENVSASGYVPPGVPITYDWKLEVESVQERGAEDASDAPASAAEALARWRQAGDNVSGDVASGDPGETVTITPANPRALTASDLLAPSVWQDTPSIGKDVVAGTAGASVAATGDVLAAIGTGQGGDATQAANPWFFFPPFMTLGFMRYNPVEGVSTGTQLRRDFGWWRSALSVRIATRSLATPDIDFTLQRDHPGRRLQISLYRALRGGALGIGGIDGWPGYLVTAGDSADFHWSRGATIRLIPGNGQRNRLSLSLFAERDAEIGTDAERDRFGASVEWRPWWGGLDDGSLGGGGTAGVRGSLGDNPHIKTMVEGALVIPLVARMSLGLQGGVAEVWGDPAPQDLWQVGTTGSWLRGHRDPVEASRTWMGRVDLQRTVRFLQLSVFGDWASVEDLDFCAVGAGLVFLDGLLRLDLARGVRCGRPGPSEAGWRFHPRGFTFF